MTHDPGAPKWVKAALTPEQKAEVIRRSRSGGNLDDGGFLDKLLAVHGYSRFDCRVHYVNTGSSEDAFLMCAPRAV